MSSLTTCLKKAGAAIDAQDKAQILAQARQYRTDGLAANDAAKKAVAEQLEAVRGLIAAERAPVLAAPTREEVIAKQEREAKAEKTAADTRRREEQQAREEDERKRIAQASQAAADTFELGGDAMDNLTGQGGLFANESHASYNVVYETDLFGEPLPASAGRNSRAKRQPAADSGDVQPGGSVLGDTAAPAGDYFIRTIVGKSADRQLGTNRILSAKDAAQATAYLYRSAVERFDAIVTDKSGKPLAVVGGFKGATTQTSVYPATVMGEAIRVPGAARIWFSHNHPSGNANLSRADESLNAVMSKVFRGSGIEPMGLLAVAGNRFAFVDSDGQPEYGDIAPPKDGVVVPVIEREIIPSTEPRVAIDGPQSARQVADRLYKQAKSPGVMLLDAQNKLSAWMPVPQSAYGSLRGTGGLNALYRAASESNAATAILVHGGELDARVSGSVTASENIAAALQGIDVRPLDSINAVKNTSAAESGFEVASGPVFARGDSAWRSGLEDAIAGLNYKQLPAFGWADALKGLVNKGLVKQDEIEWAGLGEWLALQSGKVTKEQVLGYLDANGVQVQEVTLGDAIGDSSRAKYAKYTLPGGENYREVLLTLPEKRRLVTLEEVNAARAKISDLLEPVTRQEYDEMAADGRIAKAPSDAKPYKSGHWGQPNVLAHIRLNDRTDADGKRVLFVEEIQSDWGQDGKKKGFKGKTQEDAKRFFGITDEDWSKASDMDREAYRNEMLDSKGGDIIPSAPFVTKTDGWLNLALKRVITMAAQGGYDKVAFVTGEQSAERYDLSKQVKQLAYQKNADGTFKLSAETESSGSQMMGESIPANKLEDYVGKEVAQRIVDGSGTKEKWMDGMGQRSEWSVMRGLDLKVGDEGMKAFYDQIVPNATKAMLKKLGGGQMESVNLAMVSALDVDYSQAQPGFTITPAMREKASRGLPMFAKNQPLDPKAFDRKIAPRPPGMAADDVQAVATEIARRWRSGPAIKVVRSTLDLPVDAPSDVRGLIHKGTAYLVAQNLQVRQDVVATLAHEVVGHYGLWKILGARGTRQFEQNIQLALKSGNVPLLALSKRVRETYVDADGKFNLTPEQEANEIAAMAIEEAIDADGNFKAGYGFMKQVWARVAEFLRELGFKVKFTNAELQGILVASMRGLEIGKRFDGGAQVMVAAARADGKVSIQEAIVGNPLGRASQHPDYAAAKAGDVQAALRVADSLVTEEFVAKVRSAIGSERPVVVPVVSVEATGRNKLPLAAAEILAGKLRLETDAALLQSNSPKRTAMDGLDRIFAAPEFLGEVIAGRSYLLVDDTLTQGATFAAMDSHIRAGGGKVVGAVALTGKQYSARLQPSTEVLDQLRGKLGDIENDFRAATGYGFDALTQSEARYLANFSPVDTLRARILSEGNAARQPLAEKGTGQPQALSRGKASGGPSMAETGDDLLTPYTPGEAVKKQEAEDAARKAEAEQPKAPKGRKVTADQVDMFNPQDSLFSRGDGADAGLKAFSRLDDLYALPKSKATAIAQIARDNGEEVDVRTTNLGGEKLHTLTFSDGTVVRITERSANPYGQDNQVYGMDTEGGTSMPTQVGRPGENPEEVPPTGDVWLDVSQNTPANLGTKAYNIAATFAHNTGQIFIGDPNGLTDMALRRRTDQMLASALKFGTTQHLAPHPRQVAGDAKLGVPPLRWVYGDHTGNVERMIDVTLDSLDNAFPDATQYRTFDPATGEYRDPATGLVVPLGSLSVGEKSAFDGGRAQEARAGWRTFARAAYLRSFRGSDGRAEGSRILDRASNDASRFGSGEAGGEAAGAEGKIFYARGGVAPQLFTPTVWNTPDPTSTDKIIYELQDGRVDLKRVQQAIEQSGQRIEEKFDARLAETIYPGRVAYRSQRFVDTEAKPLLKAMATYGVPMDELADYLHARGAQERNAQIAKVNRDLPDGGAGTNSKGMLLTNDNARDYLAAITPARKKVLDVLAAKVDAITAGTRELLVREGLEKQETIDTWTATYKNYVPMFRDEAESGNPHPQGTGMTVRGSASRRAVGSTKEVTNILAHVLMQREAAITRAEKNRVALSLYGMALAHPNPEFWTTIRPNMTAADIGTELQRMGIDPMTATLGMERAPTITTVDPDTGKKVNRPNPMYKSLPGAITLRINGEDRVLMLNAKTERGARMAENLKNLDGLTKFDIAGSIVGQSTRWIASVNTQYNPAFGLVNVIRDTLGASVNLGSTALKGNSLKVLRDTVPAMQGIARALTKDGAGGQWGDLYRQFQADGGQTGWRDNFKDASDRSKAIERELNAAGKLTPGKAAHAVLDLLDGFNTTMENAVRLSAYKAALDKGMSRPNAARLARELTVDFNRKGRMGREAGPLYAFFNASVQGSARTIETLRGPTGAKVILGGLGLGVVQALMLLVAGYDDEDLPEFVKSRALVIPTNWSGDGEKTHVLIPYPLGLHVLPNTGRVIADLSINGGKDVGERTAKAVGEIAGAFNPLGGGNIFTADGALKTIAPTVIDPIIEIGANRNFAGGTIEREAFGESDNRPGAARAKEATQRTTTGQAYLGISKAINTLTGGTDYEAGAVSPAPERIRYIAQTVGGGVLRELEKAINASTAESRGEEVKSSQIPVVGRFYGEVDPEQATRSAYLENAARLRKLQSSVKAMEKAGDDKALDVFDKENPETALLRQFNRIQRDLAQLNREAVQVIGDPKEIKALDQERAELMNDMNAAVKELETQTSEPTLGDKVRGWRGER